MKLCRVDGILSTTNMCEYLGCEGVGPCVGVMPRRKRKPYKIIHGLWNLGPTNQEKKKKYGLVRVCSARCKKNIFSCGLRVKSGPKYRGIGVRKMCEIYFGVGS